MTSAVKSHIPWKNLRKFNLNAPFIYLILIRSASGKKYRYVGKGSGRSRLRKYERNINRVLAGKPRSAATRKYRCVHLVLAKAAKEGWRVKGYIITNCPKEEHRAQEQFYIDKYACNLNNGKGWLIGEFKKRAAEIQ